jgi:hypothetical protein
MTRLDVAARNEPSRWDGGLAGASLLRRIDGCGLPVRYVAAPIGIYRTQRYERVVERLAVSGNEFVVGAAGLFTSTAHWLRAWPDILDRITSVSVLADTDGAVGRGVYIEVRDALQRGCPVRWEGPGRRHLIRLSDLVVIDQGRSLRRYATLRTRARPR